MQIIKKRYYKKIYTGPKINKFLLKTSSFYRLYVHYLYFFGILPAKNQYKELSPEYYKQKRKNNMIFEELNFLAKHSFSSISDVTKYQENIESKLPELKGKRELLWKKHKSANEGDKSNILKEINSITEEIDTIQAQKNVSNRIIKKYWELLGSYTKEVLFNENFNKTLKIDNNKYLNIF